MVIGMWVALAGIAASAGGAAMAVRFAVWGDRSRGRKRCGRCWYDLSGGGMTCSECGWVAKGERDLYRNRPRWGIAILGVLLAAAGVEAFRRTRGDMPAIVPTSILMRWLPRAELGVTVTSSLGGPPAPDWASVEMLRRFGAGELSAEEIERALTMQGAVRTREEWPVGREAGVQLVPVAWIFIKQCMVEEERHSQNGARLGWNRHRPKVVYGETAKDGDQAVAVRIDVDDGVFAGKATAVEVRLPYRGVAPVEMTADSSEAANAEAMRRVRLSGDAAAVIVEMMGVPIESDLATEMEIEIDRGDGWKPWIGESPSEYRLVEEELAIDPSGHSRGNPSVATLRFMERRRDRPVAEWKVRFRGVKPAYAEWSPAKRYWSGEVVMTVAELTGKLVPDAWYESERDQWR